MATIVGTLGNDTLIDLINKADDDLRRRPRHRSNVAGGSDRIFGRGVATTSSPATPR